jgi:hypothetical protein
MPARRQSYAGQQRQDQQRQRRDQNQGNHDVVSSPISADAYSGNIPDEMPKFASPGSPAASRRNSPENFNVRRAQVSSTRNA